MKTRFISNLTDDKIYTQLFEASEEICYDPYCDPEQIYDVIETAFTNNHLIPENQSNNKYYINLAKQEINANGGLKHVLAYIHKNKKMYNYYPEFSVIPDDPEISSLPDIISIFQHVKFVVLAQEDAFLDYVKPF